MSMQGIISPQPIEQINLKFQTSRRFYKHSLHSIRETQIESITYVNRSNFLRKEHKECVISLLILNHEFSKQYQLKSV